MSSQIFFQCPTCDHTENLTLDEFRRVGAPRCPVHQVEMVSKQGDAEVSQAVGEILSGVTRLAAVALNTTTRRNLFPKKKQAPHE